MLDAGSRLFGRREMLTGVARSVLGSTLAAQTQASSAVIRTVLDDVRPDSLGTKATLFHEHLSFEWAKVRGTSNA